MERVKAELEHEYLPNKYRNLRGARVLQVIEVFTKEGTGGKDDMVWLRRSYFDLDGKLLAQSPDPNRGADASTV